MSSEREVIGALALGLAATAGEIEDGPQAQDMRTAAVVLAGVAEMSESHLRTLLAKGVIARAFG